MAVDNSLRSVRRSDIETVPESIWVKISLDRCEKLLIGSFCVPPSINQSLLMTSSLPLKMSQLHIGSTGLLLLVILIPLVSTGEHLNILITINTQIISAACYQIFLLLIPFNNIILLPILAVTYQICVFRTISLLKCHSLTFFLFVPINFTHHLN